MIPFHFRIANPEVMQGYLPRQEPTPGVFMGEALITNCKGKGYLNLFNTTDETLEVVVPTLTLEPYSLASENLHSLEIPKKCSNEVKTDWKLIKADVPAQSSSPKVEMPVTDSVESNDYLHLITLNAPESPTREERVGEIINLLRHDHLNLEEKEHVFNLVQNHACRFFIPGDTLSSTGVMKHAIRTTDDFPINVKQYRFPPIHKEEINKQVTELLQKDIIELSMSPYNSPVWIVPKKPDSSGNKRWRMVIDYRSLNEKTIGDGYPLPNIIDILDQLGQAQYFTTLDLALGFHQIPMNERDAHKTAFSTPHGHYQFKKMPFGLKNAPATFQRLMDCVLAGLQGNELFVYLDDIVIYSKTLEEHEIKFNRLMERIKEANLKLQPDKCEFLRKEVAYLGHVISQDGVKPDSGKINAVRNFPIPRNPKNIKQFLGLAYYRRFIPNFSKVAKPFQGQRRIS